MKDLPLGRFVYLRGVRSVALLYGRREDTERSLLAPNSPVAVTRFHTPEAAVTPRLHRKEIVLTTLSGRVSSLDGSQIDLTNNVSRHVLNIHMHEALGASIFGIMYADRVLRTLCDCSFGCRLNSAEFSVRVVLNTWCILARTKRLVPVRIVHI